MARTFRIRDPQRFLFLTLLFPLLPMSLAMIQPAWTFPLLVGFVFLLLLLLLTVLKTREFAVGRDQIRIDRGWWEQRYRPEQMDEIVLLPHHRLVIRLEQRYRIVRVQMEDYEAALRAFREFAGRHGIPLTDRRALRSVGV